LLTRHRPISALFPYTTLFRSPDVEITLEANPTSVEAGRFAALAEAGVNRVSLGLQALDPAALKFLGREHSVDEALEALAIARKKDRKSTRLNSSHVKISYAVL